MPAPPPPPRPPWAERPVLLACLAMLGAFLGVVLGVGVDRERPHLVLIVVGSLRADAISESAGAPRTPHLHRLAREGLIFREAFAHAPSALPATVAILSGRLPHETGVTRSGQAVPAEATLLAEHLARRGYRTAASVPIAGLLPPAPGLGIDRGFALFDPGPGEPLSAREGAERALSALDALEPHRGPFFLLAHVPAAHAPRAEPAGPASAEREADLAEIRGRYKLGVEAADEAIGEILAELERRGIYEKCLIVVTGDHGEALGDHGLVGHGMSLYDELLHVPLLMRLPEGRQPELLQRQRRRLVRHIDLAPTILQLLRAPRLSRASGASLYEPLARVLIAETHPPDAPRTLLAMRDQTYKLVLEPSSGQRRLFRLAGDPLELDDVSTHQGHLRLEWQRELEELAAGAGGRGPRAAR